MEIHPAVQPSSQVHFRPTTSGQRRLLFNTAEEMDNVSEAARRAHTGRGTYYYWCPRVEAGGLVALDIERSRAPHCTRIAPVRDALKPEVLEYHQQHPEAGYRTVANDIHKAHGWQKVIRHSKVGDLVRPRRVAHAVPAPASAPPPVVHAPQPNQTVNIDLCVVPLTHTDPTDWVSVSVNEAAAGVFAETPSPAPVAEWPGQAFANPTLSDAEPRQTDVAKRTAKRLSNGQRKHPRREKQTARAELNAQGDELRLAHRRRRIAHCLAAADGKVKNRDHREFERTWKTLSDAERYQRRPERRAQPAQWHADKSARRAQLQQGAAEDAAWRQDRRPRRSQLAQLAKAVRLVTAW